MSDLILSPQIATKFSVEIDESGHLKDSSSVSKNVLKKIKKAIATAEKKAKAKSTKKVVKKVHVEMNPAQRLAFFKENGVNPYPHKFHVDQRVGDFVTRYDTKNQDGEPTIASGQHLEDINETLTGRIMLVRTAGKKMIFFQLNQWDSAVQIVSQQNIATDKANWGVLVPRLHMGDVVGVVGHPGRTKKGELSIFATQITLLAPCTREMPKIFYGVKDPEVRYRQRYLDLLLNNQVANTFRTRSKIITLIRKYLDDRDFMEVETPILNAQASGAIARPFVTHHNELNMKMFMRIAPELYLKMLVIGGLDRVYEIGRNFRNEGLDSTHNVEFTTCEFYMAYADYHDLMRMTEEMVSGIVEAITGSTVVEYHKNGPENPPVTVDFKAPWPRVPMIDGLNKALGTSLDIGNLDNDETRAILMAQHKKHNVNLPNPPTIPKLIDSLVGDFLEDTFINPTFIVDHPEIMSPLAKYHRDIKGATERFELFCCGKELCNAYTELNQPMVQRERFQQQLKQAADEGDDEAMLPDEDFCIALDHGLPPTAGWGIGIDRLAMFLTNNQSIREVLLFPTMKPIINTPSSSSSETQTSTSTESETTSGSVKS